MGQNECYLKVAWTIHLILSSTIWPLSSFTYVKTIAVCGTIIIKGIFKELRVFLLYCWESTCYSQIIIRGKMLNLQKSLDISWFLWPLLINFHFIKVYIFKLLFLQMLNGDCFNIILVNCKWLGIGYIHIKIIFSL